MQIKFSDPGLDAEILHPLPPLGEEPSVGELNIAGSK